MSMRKKFILGKCIVSWLQLHPGAKYCELQEWVKYNLNVLESDLKVVLRILKKEKKLRTRKFSDIHNFMFYYAK